MKIRAGAHTHTGKVKRDNEDIFLVRPHVQLYLVADGMGGHEFGRAASHLVAESVADQFGPDVPLPDGSVEGAETPASPVLRRLVAGVALGNRRVFESLGRSGETTAGSTIVAAASDADSLVLANVGDSRAYLLREGALWRLTIDHSQVQEMVRGGLITHEEARTHPLGNVLTRAVGVEEQVWIDAYRLAPRPGDRVLLCSDGLPKELADDEIAVDMAAHDDPSDAARSLVLLAVERGGRDNVTALVLAIQNGGDAAAVPADPPVRELGSLRFHAVGPAPLPIPTAEAAATAHAPEAEPPVPSRRSPLLLVAAALVMGILGWVVWLANNP